MLLFKLHLKHTISIPSPRPEIKRFSLAKHFRQCIFGNSEAGYRIMNTMQSERKFHFSFTFAGDAPPV